MTIETMPDFYEAHVHVRRGALHNDGIPFDMLGKIVRYLHPFEKAILDNVEMEIETNEEGEVTWAEPQTYEPIIEIHSTEKNELNKYYSLEEGIHLWFFYLDIPKDQSFADKFEELCYRLTRSFDLEWHVERDAHDNRPRYIFS